ncbi:MAG: hypothetical protein ACK4M7_00605 [Burkholderiales bacterium]
MGAGSSGSKLGVNWSVVKNILIAWILTFPICALIAGLFLHLIHLIS